MRLLLTCLFLALGFSGSQLMAQQTAGPEFDVLKMDVGTWNAKISMWMDPSGDPQISEGTEVNHMAGEFWLISKFEGEFFGQAFEGHSHTTYDAKSKKYVGSWIDSMSPNASHMTGTYDKETKTFTFESKGVGMDGQPSIGKNVVVYKDKDHRHMTMYQMVGGEEVKMMEIEYERAKKAEKAEK